MAKLRDLLVLKYGDFREDVAGFFVSLNNDPELRRLFFENPTLVIRTKLRSLSNVDLTSQQDERANRMVFSALSNERFMSFLAEYQRRKADAIRRYLRSPADEEAAAELDERQIRREFAQALLEYGDRELLYNIVGAGSVFEDDDHNGHIYTLIYQIVFVYEGYYVFDHYFTFMIEFLLLGEPTEPWPVSAGELRQIAEQLAATARRKRSDGELMS